MFNVSVAVTDFHREFDIVDVTTIEPDHLKTFNNSWKTMKYVSFDNGKI